MNLNKHLREVLRSAIFVALTSIVANILVSLSLLLAFESIAASSELTGSSPWHTPLEFLAELGMDPGLLIVFAIGFLVVAGNLTAQLETRVLRTELVARAEALTGSQNRQQRQQQAGYLATLRPLYGAILSLSSELPRLVIFAGAALFLFPNLLGVWLLVGIGMVLVLAQRSFRRGTRVFQDHRRVRTAETESASNLAESLISVESNASVVPVKYLSVFLALALAPFATTWVLSGSLSGISSSWIPLWLLLISSFITLVRLSATLGLSVQRNGEFTVVDGAVSKNAE